jgi:hypothetical protein
MFPIWLVFSAFWSDLTYMNIYLITAMFATLFIDGILRENLFLSVLWLTILAQTKPHWAFALAIPILLGRWKFFVKLFLITALVNSAIIACFLLIVGPAYGWQQIIEYPRFLASLSTSFPWRGLETGFIGYNHSILQIVIFLLGKSTRSFRVGLIIKLLLLVPVIIVCIRQLLHPAKCTGYETPELALGLTFALYLGVFIWLDMVWELSMGCAVFTFLLMIHEKENILRILLWIVFLPYILVDFWQIVSYAIFGDQVVTQSGYLLTDYSAYFPIVMLVILVFYTILLRSIWITPKTKLQPNSYG